MKYVKGLLEDRKEWKLLCNNSVPRSDVNKIWHERILQPYEIRFIAISQKYNVYNIEHRLMQFNSLPANKRKAGTLQIYQLKYGEDLGEKLYKDKIDKGRHTLENYIKKWGEEVGTFKYTEANKKRRPCIENSIRLYGEERGREAFRALCESNRGNHSLQRKIQKWGYEIGCKKFAETRKKMSRSCSLEGHIEKYGVEDGTKRYQARRAALASSKPVYKSYSDASQKLFREIYELIKSQYNLIRFGALNGEYFVGKYSLDFYIDDNKRCIEFNGDNFHANPTIFKSADKPHPFRSQLTAEEIWNYDRTRIEYIRRAGIEVKVVWMKDYKENPVKVITDCLKFIKNDTSTR